MYFHVYSFKLQIHAHIYRSFIRHHKMLGVRIAKRKTSLKSRAKANPCGTKLRARIFFGAGKFASQTYPAGELKSRGNPAKVSSANIPFLADNRKCCIFFVNAKQKEIPPTRVVFLFGALSICAANRPPAATFIEKRREPAKVSPANTPFLAKNEGFCIRQTKRICCRHPCAKRISIRGEVGFLRRAHKLHTPCMDLNVPTRMDGAFCFDCKRRKHTQTGGTERFSVKFAAAPPCL